MLDFPEKLLKGYHVFMNTRLVQERERYKQLAYEGQKPETMVIACCDSRAAPETIFDTDPGEIFVMRNVANLVPPFHPDKEYHATSAALEFAVQSLKVKNIVVLGHARCGGIRSALDLDGKPLSSVDFIGKWMGLLTPAAEAVATNTLMTSSERQTALERISIRYSINNLRTFPWIKRREDQGKLALHGAWFDIATGELWIMDRRTGDFIRADD
ncbi:Carbonic anhydrase [Bartonella apihabitans]|uniref:Carbonic anhydrase n=1 Tax=Bartonella apihabitans TaxID=2750929 RepID=A0A1U9MED6_9HYPH|nr:MULTISPECIES: carbonic anhydrase [Bartonella]AQT43655.1 carbonic anhydrase [Bartonella apihabitans]AQT45897.1 carbonic anhydrase [Bartonella apihabitans]MBH9995586.1 carbonic anhydrase [Bartonella sp. P0291]MBH9996070.1 carbonic anhydrase [Bartonella sp. M0192]MBH9998230.1 carbonic anhydrase [Bartonella sp. M0191]